MMDEYYGVKELYQVVLKAKYPMNFGSRHIEAGEPILYFDNVSMSLLNERSSPIIARGGWGNMPRVIWEDKSEITFSLTEGVISSMGMGILLSAKVLGHEERSGLAVQRREGPFTLERDNSYELPTDRPPILTKPAFCFSYEREIIQNKVPFHFDGNKVIVENADRSLQYVLDYYFLFGGEALTYLIEKERFNGVFMLEGKFYMKDENDGLNYTNYLYMPKVRIVSDINLRLGERADPTTSVFNIIAMPEQTEESSTTLMVIHRLDADVDSEI